MKRTTKKRKSPRAWLWGPPKGARRRPRRRRRGAAPLPRRLQAARAWDEVRRQPLAGEWATVKEATVRSRGRAFDLTASRRGRGHCSGRGASRGGSRHGGDAGERERGEMAGLRRGRYSFSSWSGEKSPLTPSRLSRKGESRDHFWGRALASWNESARSGARGQAGDDSRECGRRRGSALRGSAKLQHSLRHRKRTLRNALFRQCCLEGVSESAKNEPKNLDRVVRNKK